MWCGVVRGWGVVRCVCGVDVGVGVGIGVALSDLGTAGGSEMSAGGDDAIASGARPVGLSWLG